MTFEERLDAMAVSLELTNQSLEHTRQVLNALAESQVRTEEGISKLLESQKQTEGIVNKLAMIARSHNDRISRLEGK
jgi:hypothetical protein